MKKLTQQNQQIVVSIVLLMFTLVFRVITLQIINVGPDEVDYWYMGKLLVGGNTYIPVNHRTVRWSIILPTFITQLIFGKAPLVYTILPILLSLIQTALLIYISYKIINDHRKAAFLSFISVLCLTAFPYMIRTGSQLRPAVFSVTYLLAAFATTLKIEKEKVPLSSIFLVSFFLFLAYLSKITNLYLFPGFAWFVYKRSGREKKSLLFSGLFLAGMYLIEHVFLFIAFSEPLGRLGIILGNHLASDYAEKMPHTFWGLFERFNNKHLPVVWKLVFVLYVASSVYMIARKDSSEDEKSFSIFSLLLFGIFTLLLTFGIKSIHPVVPFESFQNRYFTPVLPFVFIQIAWAALISLETYASSVIKICASAVTMAIALSLLMIFLTIVFYLRLYPSSFKEYAPDIGGKYGLSLKQYVAFTKLTNKAYGDGIPIIASPEKEGKSSSKPIDTVNRVFVSRQDESMTDTVFVLKTNGLELHYIYSGGKLGTAWDETQGDTPVILALRHPFRLTYSTLNEIKESYAQRD